MNIPPAVSAKPLSDFAQLRALVIEQGLLKRQPAYFITKITATGVLLVLAIVFLLWVNNLLLVFVSAAFFAFVFGQIGLLGHDAGHRQIFASSRKDMAISQVCASLLGISCLQWNEKHNEHHAHPNREDMDPDIDFPMLAFSEEQAKEKRGLWRFIVRHQAILFFPFLCFTGMSLRLNGVKYFLRNKLSKTWLDLSLMVLHFVIYFTLVFSLLTPLHAIVFIVVHQALFGLYLGLVFAPNHKGMPILEKDAKIDFLREQVLTARNVRSNSLVDFWYGGLNFQIEHHLFPTMPQNMLRKARTIIKKFCEEKNIPYYETGVARSYYEIIRHMHKVGSYCRGKPSAA